jgi:hypothetical protein
MKSYSTKSLLVLLVVFWIQYSLPGFGQVTFTSSNLPIIVINTNGQTIVDDPKIVADMGIIDNGAGVRNNLTDPFNNYSGKIGIEIRGSSSQSFPKKQYGIELRDAAGNDVDAPLLGMPSEEDWVLFAPYNDKSLMRDVLAYKLGRDQGRYAPRTRFCELVLNNEYMGVYVLIEKIKRDNNRVDINKLDPDEISGNSLTGGYIFKIDKSTGGGGDGWVSEYPPPNRSDNQTIFFQYEVPDQDEIVTQQKNYIRNYVNEFEITLKGSNYNHPELGYAKYIDRDSFIDYWIVNEVSKNVDAYRLSTFMHKQRDSDGGKLYMGPIWDFNLGFGNANYCTNGNPEGFVTEFNTICPQDWWLIPFWWSRLMDDVTFRQRLSQRWNELRATKYQTSTIHNYIDSVYQVLNQEAQQRNFQRWPVLGEYVWPNYFVGATYLEEVSWLKEWIRLRLEWLDLQIPEITSAESKQLISRLEVFPIPAVDKLYVQVASLRDESLTFMIRNSIGQSVLIEQRNQSTDVIDHDIDIRSLNAGIYFLTIQTSSGNYQTRKFIKSD